MGNCVKSPQNKARLRLRRGVILGGGWRRRGRLWPRELKQAELVLAEITGAELLDVMISHPVPYIRMLSGRIYT